MPKRALT